VKPERINTPKRDEILDRRAKVWSERVDGKTVRELAEEFGVSVGTIQGDLDAIREELNENTRYSAEVDRTIAAARLDKVARKLIAGAELVDVPDLPAISNALARIEERRARLLGLDKPFETIVHQTEASPEEARRLMAESFGRTARQETTEDVDEEPDGPADATGS